MTGQLAAYPFLAIAVLSVTDGVIWARNSQELSNKTAFDNEFTSALKGLRFNKIMNVGEEERDSDPLQPLQVVQPSSFRISVTTSYGKAVSSVDISPHLVIIYTDVVKRMSVGIILKRRTVLTTCVSTLVQIGGQLFAIKPELLVIFAEVVAHGVEPINLVAEIRRHPFCGMPFGRGPWMNDMAILILYAELSQPLEPINMASENFYNIFAEVQKKISTGAVCQAMGIEFRNTSMDFHGTSIDVRIVDKSKCERLCNYLIPQCEPQIGGYFVQFVNGVDKSRMDDWMKEAALVCGGKLYGVVNIAGFACDASLAGSAPKPEAVLHMHLSTAKLLASPTAKPTPKKSAAAAISTSWAVRVVVMTTVWVFRQ